MAITCYESYKDLQKYDFRKWNMVVVPSVELIIRWTIMTDNSHASALNE